jgi:hypothetical protein
MGGIMAGSGGGGLDGVFENVEDEEGEFDPAIQFLVSTSILSFVQETTIWKMILAVTDAFRFSVEVKSTSLVLLHVEGLRSAAAVIRSFKLSEAESALNRTEHCGKSVYSIIPPNEIKMERPKVIKNWEGEGDERKRTHTTYEFTFAAEIGVLLVGSDDG